MATRQSKSTKADAQSKVEEYTHFIDQVLRPQLKEAERLVNETEHEISEYRQLSYCIEQLNDGDDNNKVDLGYQTVYCRAQIKNPVNLFVHLGLGFHVELEAQEALEFVEKRLEFLTANKLAQRRKKYIHVQDHIQSSVNILQELERVS